MRPVIHDPPPQPREFCVLREYDLFDFRRVTEDLLDADVTPLELVQIVMEVHNRRTLEKLNVIPVKPAGYSVDNRDYPF